MGQFYNLKLQYWIFEERSNFYVVSNRKRFKGILGPILFIIYVNDFFSCFKDINCIEYADDTTLECSRNTLAVVEKRLQNNVNNASNCLFKNNLIVNAKKSNVFIISHSPTIRSASLNITLDGNKNYFLSNSLSSEIGQN